MVFKEILKGEVINQEIISAQTETVYVHLRAVCLRILFDAERRWRMLHKITLW